MIEHSRRSFLVASGAGLVAVGAGSAGLVAAASGVTLADGDDGSAADGQGAGGEGRLVAYVSDVRTGEVTVMRGDHETVVHDRALARSIARLAG